MREEKSLAVKGPQNHGRRHLSRPPVTGGHWQQEALALPDPRVNDPGLLP